MANTLIELSNALAQAVERISEHTVKFQVSSILAKTRTASRAEAVAHALRRGLIML